jgi:hypothetical protein
VYRNNDIALLMIVGGDIDNDDNAVCISIDNCLLIISLMLNNSTAVIIDGDSGGLFIMAMIMISDMNIFGDAFCILY